MVAAATKKLMAKTCCKGRREGRKRDKFPAGPVWSAIGKAFSMAGSSSPRLESAEKCSVPLSAALSRGCGICASIQSKDHDDREQQSHGATGEREVNAH
jgi:hypothetical protein